jgi:hypothetical protein
MKPQILYVSEHDGRWEVRRCGRPLAIEDVFDEAVKAARRLAMSASAGGIPAELRIGRADATYEVEGVYIT